MNPGRKCGEYVLFEQHSIDNTLSNKSFSLSKQKYMQKSNLNLLLLWCEIFNSKCETVKNSLFGHQNNHITVLLVYEIWS